MILKYGNTNSTIQSARQDYNKEKKIDDMLFLVIIQ